MSPTTITIRLDPSLFHNYKTQRGKPAISKSTATMLAVVIPMGVLIVMISFIIILYLRARRERTGIDSEEGTPTRPLSPPPILHFDGTNSYISENQNPSPVTSLDSFHSAKDRGYDHAPQNVPPTQRFGKAIQMLTRMPTPRPRPTTNPIEPFPNLPGVPRHEILPVPPIPVYLGRPRPRNRPCLTSERPVVSARDVSQSLKTRDLEGAISAAVVNHNRPH